MRKQVVKIYVIVIQKESFFIDREAKHRDTHRASMVAACIVITFCRESVDWRTDRCYQVHCLLALWSITIANIKSVPPSLFLVWQWQRSLAWFFWLVSAWHCSLSEIFIYSQSRHPSKDREIYLLLYSPIYMIYNILLHF